MAELTRGPSAAGRATLARLLALFRTSLSTLRLSPWISIALGAAVVISLCAVCGGVGLLLAPWFVCELLAVQLEARGRTVRSRGPDWMLAGLVILGMVLVVACAGWLSALGFGPDVASADAASAPLPWPETLRRVGLISGALALVVAFTAPFLHAPLILLDRGGRLGGALLESAALMRRTGVLPHLGLSFLAQALCLSPALLSAMVVARTMERAATPLGILLALPLLPLTIPLGLGMVTAAYVQHEPVLGDRRRAQRQPPLPAFHRAILITVVVAPLSGLALIGASALLPAAPLDFAAPPGEEIVAGEPGDVLRVPGTSLEVTAPDGAIRVVAGLEEPLVVPWGPIASVRVVRLVGAYAVEVRAPGSDVRAHVQVDEAGTRVDDSVRSRLESHITSWILAAFLLGFAGVSLGAPAAFAPAGQARASAALRGIEVGGLDARERSLRAALALSPFALLAAAAGAAAFLDL